MQIRDDILSPGNTEVANPIPGALAYELYRPDSEQTTDPSYGVVVYRIEYDMINQMECPPQYNHSFVIGWTVPGSNVSFKNMNFYFKVRRHEALHHDPEIRALGNYVDEERATRAKDQELENMGYDISSVPVTVSYRIYPTFGYC